MFLFFLIITVSATDYFIEPFDDIDRWINSSTREEPEKMGTFELTDDNQLKTSQDARFYTMWAP
jgi:hypothetical protein